jgi:tRNA(fMet)-specific endonuclease VapC
MYLLDTNHCSYIIDGQPQVIAALSARSESNVGINIITYAELLYMSDKSAERERNVKVIRAFLDRIDLYLLDEETAIIYSQLKINIFNKFAPKERIKRRRSTLQNLGFGENDLWIAATALQYRLTIVTADRDFDRISEAQSLSLESWI